MGNAISKQNDNIIRLDIDWADVDNRNAALTLILNNPNKIIHLVLIGRRFSPILTHCVKDPLSPNLILEIWDESNDDGTPRCRYVSIHPKDLEPFIKQLDCEEKMWSFVDEILLQQINAAHLRAFLNQAGVDESRYRIYDGGLAKIAGLSHNVHSYEWMFKENNEDWSSYVPITAQKHTEFCAYYRGLSPDERIAYFRAYGTAIPPNMRQMLPLTEFTTFCNLPENSDKFIEIKVGGPATAVIETFKSDPLLAARVLLIIMMSGAWEGDLNLLKMCFNNAVDFPATIALINMFESGYFSNGNLIMITTETCKIGPFSPTYEKIMAIPVSTEHECAREAIASITKLWADLKRGAYQPQFDMLTLLDPEFMMTNMKLFEITVGMEGQNISIGSSVNMNMSIHIRSEALVMGYTLKVGAGAIYATGIEFTPDCYEWLIKFLVH